MFSSAENLNIGTICGTVSRNLGIFDCETESAFLKTFEQCRKSGLGETWITKTFRGFHILYLFPFPVRGVKAEDMELRGEGQFALLPPSQHPSGPRYVWVQRTPQIAQISSVEDLAWLKLRPAIPNQLKKTTP